MSEPKFRLQVDTLFSTAEVFKAEAIYINALEFDYPLSDESVKIVKDLLLRCMVKTYAIIESNYLIGKRGVVQLAQLLEEENIRLNVFKTESEGNKWLTERCTGKPMKNN